MSRTAADISLEKVLGEIAIPSGIQFRIAPDVARDRVHDRLRGTGWPEVVANLLRGYNYVGTWGARDRLITVNVTGRNGDGRDPPPPASATAESLLSYRPHAGPLPAAYQSLAPGSIYPVTIPAERLRHMPKGTRISVSLPDGRYELVHDSDWHHENGDLTWTGYLDGPQGPYRTILTLGDHGTEGRIQTPGGLYHLESEGPAGWLLDINASGLRPAGLDGDERRPGNTLAGAPAAAPSARGRVPDRINTTPNRRATLNAAGQPIIDVLLLYTSGLASPKVLTRLNHLLALANQALADSRADAVLRLAAARETKYPNGGSNDTALNRLSDFRKQFGNVPQLRRKTGADIVLLIRPFRLQSQGGNCGEAWVNGSEGSDLTPDLAFGVIGYGTSGGYYCSDYTLAHEVGHVLGATHDRAHANVPGKYDFSYGYGIAGLFGDIMSYVEPEIGLYANPEIQCAGQPCGIPRGERKAADVALTFNKTAKTASAFVRAVKR